MGERILTTKTPKQLLDETHLLRGMLAAKERLEISYKAEIDDIKGQLSHLQQQQQYGQDHVVLGHEDENKDAPDDVEVPEESQLFLVQDKNIDEVRD